MSLDSQLQSIWYGNSRIAWLLLPLSWLFGAIVATRRWLYRTGLLHTVKVSKPIIVVGNITVGGTGKTPLVIWLAQALSTQGFKVAVIARGYGGKSTNWPQLVTRDSNPDSVGDEPVLIAQQTNAIVVVGPDRVADARRSIELGADVIVSDDGLQHYRLHRDCELAVIDGSRHVGNGHLIPAGPLREFPQRLTQVDLLLTNQRDGKLPDNLLTNDPLKSALQGGLHYRVELTQLRSLKSSTVRALDSFRDQQVHVVTGIGNPQAFLASLERHGIRVRSRVLPDHAIITQQDISFADSLPVIMTAKDAVKCRSLEVDERYWVADAHIVMDAASAERLLGCVRKAIRQFSYITSQ